MTTAANHFGQTRHQPVVSAVGKITIEVEVVVVVEEVVVVVITVYI